MTVIQLLLTGKAALKQIEDKKVRHLQLPYSEKLDIAHFSRLFDNKSECYKLFWFQAIVSKIMQGKDTFTYEELIDEMIADAWYMVTEYHLNLGPNDNLEKVVNRLSEISTIKSSEKKDAILVFLGQCNDREVLRMKRTLSQNVPYRLQAPFMESMRGNEWNRSGQKLAERINQEKRLMYYFQAYHGLQTRIKLQPDWIIYIRQNREIIQGWIELNMITYLQRRNPSVPGIVDKLYPPKERKLEKVKKYWKLIVHMQPVWEIYADTMLDEKDISIDHFVPWSYVAHDEFWNLHPTTKSINSSKSNSLPDWEVYFPLLCKTEYASYEMMWRYPKVHDEFEKCAKEHLNNLEIRGRLYREGLSEEDFSERLSEVILPVYQSARNAGFNSWTMR